LLVSGSAAFTACAAKRCVGRPLLPVQRWRFQSSLLKFLRCDGDLYHDAEVVVARWRRCRTIRSDPSRRVRAHRDDRHARRDVPGGGRTTCRARPTTSAFGFAGRARSSRSWATRASTACGCATTKANRTWKNCFSPYLYRDRNAIERMFCRLKDFRRIATRYDRLATNFLAAVCIAATVSYWL
jgi:transposase